MSSDDDTADAGPTSDDVTTDRAGGGVSRVGSDAVHREGRGKSVSAEAGDGAPAGGADE